MDQVIHLPDPQTTGGKPLMDCLRERHSTREYSRREVPLRELSNLLWAAFGLTREHAGTGIGIPGSHTAPTACNSQAIDIYVGLADGVYLYEPHAHELQGLLAEDIRPSLYLKEQAFVMDAPINMLYVANRSRMVMADDWAWQAFTYADTAFIAENVYLYCASAGLATVVRAMVDRERLAGVLHLGPDQMVTLAQTVGYAV
jgi:SagB-type dehydrogenase family enzyme